MACKQIRDAFGGNSYGGVYIVGSALGRADWRDVDIRLMLPDDEFSALFPDVRLDTGAAMWEFDPRWTLMTLALSRWMSDATGLPVDFQIQPATWANERHCKPRHAAGLRYAKD